MFRVFSASLSSILSLLLLSSVVEAATIDDASFSFTSSQTTFRASCNEIDCQGGTFVPELYAGDGVTVLGSGSPILLDTLDLPVLYTITYPEGTLANGTPYFISLSETAGLPGGTAGDYLALTFGPSSSSNTCDGITVFDSSFRVNADTSDGIDDFVPGHGCGMLDPFSGIGKDLVYAIQLDEATGVRLVVDPEDGFDTAFYVVTDCNDMENSCVAGKDAGPASTNEELYFDALAKQTYFIIVDGKNANSGSFVLRAKIDAPAPPEGEDTTDGEETTEGEDIGDGEGVAEGEGAIDGEGEFPLVLGFVTPDAVTYSRPTDILLGGTFSDEILENTGALSIRFTATKGHIDTLNDSVGTITAVSDTLLSVITPVRNASGESGVYLVANLESRVLVSNTLPFTFLEQTDAGRYEQLLFSFASTDVDSDGRVTMEEILLQFPGFPQNTFDACDVNDDDFLSVSELLALAITDVVHSGDTNGDYIIGLSELIRIIQLYNTGAYACAENAGATEDGFETLPPGDGDRACIFHSLDLNEDNSVSLSELLRGIQLYNLQGYQYCVELETEDDFCSSK